MWEPAVREESCETMSPGRDSAQELIEAVVQKLHRIKPVNISSAEGAGPAWRGRGSQALLHLEEVVLESDPDLVGGEWRLATIEMYCIHV